MEERILWDSRDIMGESVFLSALKMPDGELLIVATDECSTFASLTLFLALLPSISIIIAWSGYYFW